MTGTPARSTTGANAAAGVVRSTTGVSAAASVVRSTTGVSAAAASVVRSTTGAPAVARAARQLLAALAILAALAGSTASAQDQPPGTGPEASVPGTGTGSGDPGDPAGAAVDLSALGPPGPPPPPEAVPELARAVGLGLRCPVCQGLSVADSPSPSARQMYDRVVELTAAGYSGDQIRDYFVGRYGEWVLLEPTMSGNALVWLGPGVALGVGLAWVAVIAARWRQKPEPLPSDTGELPKDEYEQRLLSEIEK